METACHDDVLKQSIISNSSKYNITRYIRRNYELRSKPGQNAITKQLFTVQRHD